MDDGACRKRFCICAVLFFLSLVWQGGRGWEKKRREERREEEKKRRREDDEDTLPFSPSQSAQVAMAHLVRRQNLATGAQCKKHRQNRDDAHGKESARGLTERNS